MHLLRAMSLFAAASIAAALAGCGATLPQTASITNDASGVGAAYPSTGPEKVEGMPTPFGDQAGPAPGGREVIENPTIADIMASSPLPEMSWGSPTAPVTIVQYMSLTCPHCRNFHLTTYPELKRRFIDSGKVRYILREFPIGKT